MTELPDHRTLLWTPHAKQRPRTMYTKGKYRTFTPRETVKAEAGLREQWEGEPVEGPIGLALFLSDTEIEVMVHALPEPESRKLRRGDIDNYTKLVMDALNGKAWVDDRQIVRLHVVEK